jgi:hypothetical protein
MAGRLCMARREGVGVGSIHFANIHPDGIVPGALLLLLFCWFEIDGTSLYITSAERAGLDESRQTGL